MGIDRTRFSGSSNIGIFIRAVGPHVLLPSDSPPSLLQKVRECFSSEPIAAKVYQSSLIGVFIAGNSSAMLVPRFMSQGEVDEISARVEIPIHIVDFKINALGNVILANDYGALVHPGLSDKEVELLRKALCVRVLRGTIAGLAVTGSLVAVTNRGCVLPTGASPDELNIASELFGVECFRGTINSGSPYIRIGLVANEEGALVGNLTTPMEMGTVVEALGLAP